MEYYLVIDELLHGGGEGDYLELCYHLGMPCNRDQLPALGGGGGNWYV